MNRAELESVFTEWDRRYRADPETFMTDVMHLLGNTPASYGASCAVYFEQLLNERRAQIKMAFL